MIKTNRLKQVLAVVIMAVVLGGVGQLTKLPTPLFPDDYSTIVVDQSGDYLRVFLNSEEQWIFPPSQEELPQKLKTAVINFEDKRFYSHWGVDPLAVARAMGQDLKAMKKVSGASTITMQVARLAEEKERTMFNKLIEMGQALRLETQYSKEELLRFYLTHAPYGGNIVGYKAASLRYFGKEPSSLTWGQAALLAVLPNSPALINPHRGRERLKQKRNRLLAKLKEKRIIDQTTCQLAQAEGIPKGEISFDLAAPHLARKLKKEQEQNIIKTTIDKELQLKVKGLVQNYMKKMKQHGVYNASVLVADTKTGAVKVYLGSNDYFDQQHGGKIDGVQMKRSSGSILKPFLYALAMDQGLIVADSKLKDIPTSYGAYSPYNANHQFKGVVTAQTALIDSLNAPAVALLDQYGIKNFYNFLEQAGVTTLFRTAEEYGLPLVLGGAEVKIWDIAALYRGLGNAGYFSGLQVTAEEGTDIFAPVKQSQQLITKGSAYLTLDIIDDLKRPGQDYFWRNYTSQWRIAWKTGTSYGNRDAWAVGTAPDWTIAVWLGNFSGQENKELSGLNAAAPLFFEIFNSLEKDYYQKFFSRPSSSLEEIKVSAETAYRLPKKIVEQDLADVTTAIRAKGAKPLRYSPYEEIVYSNQAQTKEVCSRCWNRDDVSKSLKVLYPPQVVQYLQELGNDKYISLPHQESCPTVNSTNPIEFIYPQDNSIIAIPRETDGEYQQLRFKIAHTGEQSKLFWYLDQKYLGCTKNKHQKSLLPTNGAHQLHVVDQEGYHREIKFYIKRN
ncbi:MAG: penicillin-binding protein 1C [Bacillota bacterium]